MKRMGMGPASHAGMLLLTLAAASAPGDAADIPASLEGLNLKELETTLVDMAKTGVTPGLSSFVTQVFSLTKQIKEKLHEQLDISQRKYNESWWDWWNCSYNASNDLQANLTYLDEAHMNCRENQSQWWRDWQVAIKAYEFANETWWNWYEKYLADCNVPESCLHTLPIPAGSSLPWMITTHADWKVKYETCKHSEDEVAKHEAERKAREEDADTMRKGYYAKREECDRHQGRLEKASCNDNSSDECLVYIQCWSQGRNHWLQMEDALENRSQELQVELRGTLRIECYLRAFNASVEQEDIALGPLIDACRNSSFNSPEHLSSLFGKYFPYNATNEAECAPEDQTCKEPPFIRCNETDWGSTYNITYSPGSTHWISAFYTPMPNGTVYAECNASCCVGSSTQLTQV
eukprot:TRINITY_DN49352_c0_g1_i1.p1 TRINITY_DN49352_c0_g1~~TRINITY_DN49352_c0_g1_i1.p1  ORF type:complete len:406 (+),score=58.85 TRINITY_DN49352_c0_g1_i1:81-1298(+)